MKHFKSRLDAALNHPGSPHFQLLNDALALVTFATIASIVLETVPSLHNQYHPWFLGVEYVAVAIFTTEYLSRLYVARSRRQYVFSFFGLIDLLAIIPSFVHLANLTFLKSARVLRILRLLRMLRLAKLSHYHGKPADAEHHAPIYKLNIQIYFMSLTSAIVLLGSLIYVLEAHHPGFSSIPAGMLWAADVILGGGIQGNDALTLPGQITTLVARFIGLVLLGVLVAVMGTLMRSWLFGKDPVAVKKKRIRRPTGPAIRRVRRKRSRIENPDS